ncbi:MAG: glutamate synthase [Stappia sp.]|uniref:chaperone NapD n=1 Tax=Stappia sp. TaxID=1870903 RepID=UPI000C466B70|nr:chaperone NapD [Stappia sp.]MAA98706.1 glutamate synthase [Stappia sp.]MBM20464.1 glutamate synthase [Stappia sp.]|tara:strand:+ start:195 stop:449 length:255 start_codon:yes stop_codon:yes gene_type:complete
MPDSPTFVISSAVVTAMPDRVEAVRDRLSEMPDIEVTAAEGIKLVIVLEGRTRNTVGGRLSEIATLDGVISANMVFEHVEEGTS